MTAHRGGWNIVVFKNSFIDDHRCCTILIDKTVKPGLPQAGRSLELIESTNPSREMQRKGKQEGTKGVGKQTEEGIKRLAACKQISALLWQSPVPHHCPVLYLPFKTSNSVCSHSLTLCMCTASARCQVLLWPVCVRVGFLWCQMPEWVGS